MDFQPSDTQKLIAQTVDSIVADGIGDPWAALAELGLLGAEIPEADGGSGGSFEDLAVILKSLGRGGGSGAFIPVVVMAAALIARLGDQAQKATWLPALIEGRSKIVLARARLAPDGVEDVDPIVAVPDGEGWRLDGHLPMVLGGADAAGFIVEARVGDASVLVIVPATASGMSVERFDLYDGSGAGHLRLDGVRVTVADRLGAEGQAVAALSWALDRANAAFANEAVGLMERLCDLTLDYIKMREQFGRTLGSFQVVQHRMMDMRIHLEMAKSMAILATVVADHPDPRGRALDVSAARAAIGKAGRMVAQSAIQLHGAIALTEEYPAGRYVRRLTLIERAFGDAAWHLDRFAALSREAA